MVLPLQRTGQKTKMCGEGLLLFEGDDVAAIAAAAAAGTLELFQV